MGPSPDELLDRGDTVCYGDFVKWVPRAKLFWSLWSSLGRLILFVPPERLPRRAVRSFGGAEPPIKCGWVFFLRSVSSSSSAESSPRAICYPQAHPQRIGACIMTYSGREEERAPSIYRSSVFVALSGGVEGAPFQRVFFGGLLRKFLCSVNSSFRERFSVEPVLLTANQVLEPARAR